MCRGSCTSAVCRMSGGDARQERGLIEKLPGIPKPFDPDDSILDDVIGWIIAFQGLWFQLNTGFSLPSPWNLILAPLSFFELYLRVQVSGGLDGKGDGTDGTSARRLEEVMTHPSPRVPGCGPADVAAAWNMTAPCSSLSGHCWCTVEQGMSTMRCHG